MQYVSSEYMMMRSNERTLVVLFAGWLCGAGCIKVGDSFVDHTIRGVAVEQSTGQPLAGATIVVAHGGDPEELGMLATTNASGFFEVKNFGVGCSSESVGGIVLVDACAQEPLLEAITVYVRSQGRTGSVTLHLEPEQEEIMDGGRVLELGAIGFSMGETRILPG